MNALGHDVLNLVGVTECSMCSYPISAKDFTDRLRDQIERHAPVATQLGCSTDDVAIAGRRVYLQSGYDLVNGSGEELRAMIQPLSPAVRLSLRDWTNSVRQREGSGAKSIAVALADRLDSVLNSMALADSGDGRSEVPSATVEADSLPSDEQDDPVSAELTAALGLAEVDEDADDLVAGDSDALCPAASDGSSTSNDGPLSLPEDGTPRYVIDSAVQEETLQQMCTRLKLEESSELAQEDSVDLDPPPAPGAATSATAPEPELPPVSLEPPRGPEVFGLAPDQDDAPTPKATAAELAALDVSIRETLERELGAADGAPDAIDLGEPLMELDLGDELELELDDAANDDLLDGA